MSVGNDTYNLTKYNKIQLVDETTMKAGNTGRYLLPYWKIMSNLKKIMVKYKLSNNQRKQALGLRIVERVVCLL